jgi:integrase/recombinase XerD
VNHVAALRFVFVRTLKRPEFRDYLPYPNEPERLPTILSLDEVSRLSNARSNLFRRALLMTLYATGMRRSELVHLRVSDIDSQHMVIRVTQGKGSKDRDLPLNPELLETLRAYWRWRKPKEYLFPCHGSRKGPDGPASDNRRRRSAASGSSMPRSRRSTGSAGRTTVTMTRTPSTSSSGSSNSTLPLR